MKGSGSWPVPAAPGTASLKASSQAPWFLSRQAEGRAGHPAKESSSLHLLAQVWRGPLPPKGQSPIHSLQGHGEGQWRGSGRPSGRRGPPCRTLHAPPWRRPQPGRWAPPRATEGARWPLTAGRRAGCLRPPAQGVPPGPRLRSPVWPRALASDADTRGRRLVANRTGPSALNY